ncbi:MAG: patatin-like phospholipase family protein [Haliscomenobacter sp.]|nr:patatin-like phospholipase family protein [Haliscomenobacter sp.]
MGKEFKILAIDGGGIKGLYSACILKHLEERHGDCHLADYFDLICGTSTGGLIALALSLRKRAGEIADFYAKKGEEIFPYVNRRARAYAFIRQTFWFGKYSDVALRKSLEAF